MALAGRDQCRREFGQGRGCWIGSSVVRHRPPCSPPAVPGVHTPRAALAPCHPAADPCPGEGCGVVGAISQCPLTVQMNTHMLGFLCSQELKHAGSLGCPPLAAVAGATQPFPFLGLPAPNPARDYRSHDIFCSVGSGPHQSGRAEGLQHAMTALPAASSHGQASGASTIPEISAKLASSALGICRKRLNTNKADTSLGRFNKVARAFLSEDKMFTLVDVVLG